MNDLESKFKKHLHSTVGKIPTDKEMLSINKIAKREYAKIYDKPDKPVSITRDSYNTVLSKIWPKIVAKGSSFREVTLLSEYTKIRPTDNITSIASGLCVFKLFLAKEFIPDGKICCFDISERMCSQAKVLAKKLRQTNIEIGTAPATKLPARSNSQEIVLARRPGLQNDRRWITVLREARRVLKKDPSSRFIYTVAADFNKPTVQIKADLREAGLKFIAIRKFGMKESASFMIIAKL